MAKKSGVKMNIKKLEVIQTALKKLDDGNFHVQVGIFGEKGGRKSKETTNAEIGFIHEMGSVSSNIPRRSFLWDTFINQGDKLMGMLSGDVKALFKEGKVALYLKHVGIACTNLVGQAFETSGWGSWAPLKYRSIMDKVKGSLLRRKQQAAEVLFEGAKHTRPLLDTGQLMRSVTSRVVK